MKSAVLLACSLLTVVFCFSVGKPTLNPYPLVFTAVFNASDQAQHIPGTMNTFILDVPNKRARAEYANALGDYLLIFRPDGADPTSPYGKNYTSFVLNPKQPNNTKCYYQQINDYGPWPSSWMRALNDVQIFEAVGPFYDLPEDLVYTGSYYVQELNVWTDRWDSVKTCNLFRSHIGVVPCNSVMFTKGSDPLPVMDIQAVEGRNFENEQYYVRVYHSFQTHVYDSDFSLPKNWQYQCGNGDAGFQLSPSFDFTLYSDGSTDNTPTVSLASQPIESLGPVMVTLTASPSDPLPCADCVSSGTLTFTSENWFIPQKMPFSYQKAGCSNMVVQAKGGGYDWNLFQTTWTVYTCAGSASQGCVSPPQCGSSLVSSQ